MKDGSSIILSTLGKGAEGKRGEKISIIFGEGKNLAQLAKLISKEINLKDSNLKSLKGHSKIAKKMKFLVDEDT